MRPVLSHKGNSKLKAGKAEVLQGWNSFIWCKVESISNYNHHLTSKIPLEFVKQKILCAIEYVMWRVMGKPQRIKQVTFLKRNVNLSVKK